jgi:hypothetical protein
MTVMKMLLPLGPRDFPFSASSKLGMHPALNTKDASVGVRQLWHEPEHWALSSTKVSVWGYTSTPPYVYGVVLD